MSISAVAMGTFWGVVLWSLLVWLLWLLLRTLTSDIGWSDITKFKDRYSFLFSSILSTPDSQIYHQKNMHENILS